MAVIILLTSLVIFLSGLIQGITSFGFSLIAVPLLGVFLPLKIIVPLLVIFSFIMNSMILYQLRKYVDLKEIYLLIGAAVVATPIGAMILVNVNEDILKLMVGCIVLFSAVMFKFGFKIHIKNEKKAHIPVGIISGLLNGSVSISGPPIILFLTNQDKNKQIFRATLTSFFWILNIITIFIFINRGIIDQQVMTLTGTVLPSLIIGSFVGIKLGNKVPEKLFKNITIVLMGSMGLLSIITSI